MKRMTFCEFAEKLLFIVLTLFVTYLAAANELQFEGGNVIVSWNYLSASQEIEFEVKAKALGYVAMGLTKTRSGMQNLDLFAGGVDGSGRYLKDYYATGTSTPKVDDKQSYTLLSATEANGVTTVRCKRKLNTQDDEDQLIQPGDQLYIAWAYHTSSDTLNWHSSRGYSTQMHVLVPVMTTSKPSPTIVGSTRGTTISADLTSETPPTNVATTMIKTASSILTSSPTTSTTSSSSTTSTTSLTYSSASISATSTPSTQMTTATTATATDTTATDTTTTVKSSQTITTSTITVFYSSTNTNIQRQATTTATPTPSTSVSPTTNPTNIAYDNDRSYHNGDVLIHWKFDSNTKELFFKLEVKAAGWVGLGISNTNSNMKDMDVVVAGVSGGQGYIGDYYSKTKVEPPRDGKQDYILRTAMEIGEKTTVEFKRKINTGDDKDLQIVPGKSYYIAWAYHISNDKLSYHSQRGYSTEKVVLVAEDGSTSTSRPTSKTTRKIIPITAATMARCSLVLIILSVFTSVLFK